MIKVYTTKDVALILRISEDYCRKLIRDKKIKGYKEGRRGGFRVTDDALCDYVEGKLKGASS